MNAEGNAEVDGHVTEPSKIGEKNASVNEAADTTHAEEYEQETSGLNSDGKEIEDLEVETHENPFSKKTWKEDLTLVVEGKNLHVSKVILGTASSVFNDMFEKGPIDTMELPAETSYHSAVEFLLCLYPNTRKTVNENNLHEVMTLAFHYEVEVLKQECLACLKATVNKDTSCDVLLKLIQACRVCGLHASEEICWKAVEEKSFEDIDGLGSIATQSSMSARIRKMKSEKILSMEQENASLKAVFRYLLSCMNPSKRREMESFFGGCFYHVTVEFQIVDKRNAYLLKKTDDIHDISVTVPPVDYRHCLYVTVKPATSLKMLGQIVLINRVNPQKNHLVDFSEQVFTKSGSIMIEVFNLNDIKNETKGYLIQSVGILEIRYLSIGC